MQLPRWSGWAPLGKINRDKLVCLPACLVKYWCPRSCLRPLFWLTVTLLWSGCIVEARANTQASPGVLAGLSCGVSQSNQMLQLLFCSPSAVTSAWWSLLFDCWGLMHLSITKPVSVHKSKWSRLVYFWKLISLYCVPGKICFIFLFTSFPCAELSLPQNEI